MMSSDGRTWMKEWFKARRRDLVFRFVTAKSRPGRLVSSGRMVVIAPHPDDEVFGCGGLIVQQRRESIPVDVIYLTAGERAHTHCCGMDPEALGRERRRQAVSAGRILGVQEGHLHWLGLEDGHIPGESVRRSEIRNQSSSAAGFEESVTRLAALLETLAPEEVYCPHPLDGWPDHEAAAKITLAAVLRLSASGGQGSGFSVLNYYLVWGWYSMPLRSVTRWGLKNAWRLDISSVAGKKSAAIDEYVTKHPAQCLIPYVGNLPPGFLGPFTKPYEIFFRADGAGRADVS